MKGLSINKSVVLHDDLGILINVTYRKEFELTKWLNETLTEDLIKAWIEKNKR